MTTRMLTFLAGVLMASGLVLIFVAPLPGDHSGKDEGRGAVASTLPGKEGNDGAGTGSTDPTQVPEADPEREHPAAESAEQKEQRAVVDGFAKAFTADLEQKKWIAGLKPYVIPRLLDGFTYTDPKRLPENGPVATVTRLEPSGNFEVTFKDKTKILCTVIGTATGWAVSSVEPVRSPAPSGTDL